MTPNPCFDATTRTDCPRRCVGCKADCPEWKAWFEIHEQEKEKAKTAKYNDRNVDDFLVLQGQRRRRLNSIRAEQEKRRMR